MIVQQPAGTGQKGVGLTRRPPHSRSSTERPGISPIALLGSSASEERPGGRLYGFRRILSDARGRDGDKRGDALTDVDRKFRPGSDEAGQIWVGGFL